MSNSQVNKHGLKRSDLHADVKRKIRKECGFGCVICGNGVYHYEHVDPEFNDALEHDPNRMAILCGGCHDKVTRGRISKETVKKSRANPKALQIGYSFDAFDIGSKFPVISLGPVISNRCNHIIEIESEPVFWINPPEEPKSPFRINAVLRNRSGQEVLSIIDNEWRIRPESWDVDVVGKIIKIRNDSGDIALIMRTDPPNKLTVERMYMMTRGNLIQCDDKEFFVKTSSGLSLSAKIAKLFGCQVAISIEHNSIVLGKGGGSVEYSVIANPPRSKSQRRNPGNIRRNARCPCGSPKKFKHCCGSYGITGTVY